MPSTLDLLTALINGSTSRSEEREVLDILRSAPAAELDEAMEKLDTVELFDSVDNRLIGRDHRDDLVQLLAYERRDDLGLHAQASIIRGMQEGHTDEVMEAAIRDILLSHAGNDLSHLKNTINLAKGRHDLEGLVFSDVDDEGIREEILAHFAASSSLDGERQAKALSDIDDTALAKIHEDRYPKGSVIPGVLEFYEALDLGPRDEPISRGDLTFVTARPSDALGLMKGHSRETLTKAGLADMSIMTGSIFNLATHDSMAAKKVENIDHYAKLYPEYDLVFIGDSGQGDIAVGEAIVEAHGDVVRAVFIHDVVAMAPAEREKLAAKNIWVVDTYVGAAAKAHELGLVSPAGVKRVIAETNRLLDEMAWETPEQEQTIRSLVQRDAAAAGL